MENVVGMGVVGAGSIGIRGALMHLSMPDVKDRVRLAAICDPVPGRAQAAADKYGVDAAYESYEELLDDPNVDMVTICSPISLHYEQGLMAIEADKHIHFNKTMTIKVTEADEIIRRAADKKLRIVASPGTMSDPFSRRMRKLILEGSLGQLGWAITGSSAGNGLYHLNEKVRQGDGILSNINPDWYFKKPAGGPMYDVSVYVLHNLTGILGPAKRITSMSGIAIPEHLFKGRKIANEMDDSTMMLLDFGNSIFAVVHTTIAGAITGWTPHIYGTEGSIIGTMFNDKDISFPEDRMPHVTGAHAHMEESHVFEDMMQLVDWVREDRPSIATAEHARHVIDIIESGYKAAETGQTQALRTSFEPIPLEAL